MSDMLTLLRTLAKTAKGATLAAAQAQIAELEAAENRKTDFKARGLKAWETIKAKREEARLAALAAIPAPKAPKAKRAKR